MTDMYSEIWNSIRNHWKELKKQVGGWTDKDQGWQLESQDLSLSRKKLVLSFLSTNNAVKNSTEIKARTGERFFKKAESYFPEQN